MAKDGIEVEVKIPVDKKLFKDIKRKVKSEAKFENTSRVVDIYFNAPHRNFLAGTRTEEFLRVRSNKSGSYFTYKHGYWNSKNEHMCSDEFETRVENGEKLKKILSVLDFKKILTIDKIREIYNQGDKFEICFDEVKYLGYFIEIESLKNFGGTEKTMEKLYGYAKSLGLDPTKRDSKGYVTLMMEKKHLFGR